MKNRLILFIALFLIVVGDCFGQITFQKLLYLQNSFAGDVQLTNDGGYILAGTTGMPDSSNFVVYLIKTNNEGDTLWTKMFSGIGSFNFRALQQTVDNGYIIVAGRSLPSTGNDGIQVIRTNSGGDTLWTKAYGGDTSDYVDGNFVQQTNDSGFIITGRTLGFSAGGYDVYLIKLNYKGDIIWTKTFGTANDDEGVFVKQTSDSGYIICGSTWSYGDTSADFYLIKTNAIGDILWTKTYGDSNTDIAASAQETNDGGYIIAGTEYSRFGTAGEKDIYVIRTDVNGDTIWTRAYGGSYSGVDVQETTDDGYIVYGHDDSHPFLIRINSDGDSMWTRIYTYGLAIYFEGSVKQTSDNGFIIAGTTQIIDSPPSGYKVYLIKTDSQGNSGFYESGFNTISRFPNIQIGNINTIVGSGGAVQPTSVIVSSGGAKDSTLCLSVGIDELIQNNLVTLYPNPAQNEFTIKSTELRIKEINIYNVLGKEAAHPPTPSLREGVGTTIDVSALSAGIYFVRIVGENGLWTGKFVKE